MSAKTSSDLIDKKISEDYQYGFVTDIESETLPPGLDEDVIRFISNKKEEPTVVIELATQSLPSLAKNGRTCLG
ncbi:MAG: hypothetical protein Ct9H300mP9_4350 [Candidatus Neomarinimicrobiota bacterium]|nr:MAG: hypothetical protein Ct9H300mP9_4350 [Candidatus Neomarinimicrobiota bacterium]